MTFSEMDDSLIKYTDLTAYKYRNGIDAYIAKYDIAYVIPHPKYNG